MRLKETSVSSRAADVSLNEVSVPQRILGVAAEDIGAEWTGHLHPRLPLSPPWCELRPHGVVALSPAIGVARQGGGGESHVIAAQGSNV